MMYSVHVYFSCEAMEQGYQSSTQGTYEECEPPPNKLIKGVSFNGCSLLTFFFFLHMFHVYMLSVWPVTICCSYSSLSKLCN